MIADPKAFGSEAEFLGQIMVCYPRMRTAPAKNFAHRIVGLDADTATHSVPVRSG
jgi:hypothetical protein